MYLNSLLIFLEPGIWFLGDRPLRRTLVLVNGEWAMVNHCRLVKLR